MRRRRGHKGRRRCVVAVTPFFPEQNPTMLLLLRRILPTRAAVCASRALATVMPPPNRPGAEKIPASDDDLTADSARDVASVAAAEKSADATSAPLQHPALGRGEGKSSGGHGRSGGQADEEEMSKEKSKGTKEEDHVGAPPQSLAPTIEADLSSATLVPPSRMLQEGGSTTVPKGEPNTMAAPEQQGGG